MAHAVTWLVVGALVVLVIEAIQAVTLHHLKRLGLCALAGAVTAGLFALAASRQHTKLAATAARYHETVSQITLPALLGIAVIVTVASYAVITWRNRGRGRSWPMPAPREYM